MTQKWQQSIGGKPPETYTLFRCNLNDNTAYTEGEGTLLSFDFDSAGDSFNERTHTYISRYVFEEDRDKYAAFLNADTMLAEYYRGHRTDSLDFRELLPEGGFRWLRLTVDLVEYPNSTDVEAYLMYENIDEAKTIELQIKALSETDSLTGLLNRPTFIARVDQALRAAKPEARHAMLMLDIDGFKLVNDVFGHGVGDRALMDIASSLRSIIRRGDLLARLGGDEYLIFLRDIQDENAAARKAQMICAATRKTFSAEVQITGSIGIAFAPRDGMDFDTLYNKADSALYYVKDSGRDNFIFYSNAMESKIHEADADNPAFRPAARRRRILIVDDNRIDHALLQNVFKNEFIIEKARDGKMALLQLRHYGSAISAVLLDLMMPGMDGFAVLEQMQQMTELRSIPVVIVTGDDSREACLKAIRRGAADFITKPYDPDILRIRLHSAVSKAENERLRAANSLLEVQKEERVRFEAALESAGLTFIEFDWLNGGFLYHPTISKYLSGRYDTRKLWEILLSDMVADTQTVHKLQEYIHAIAGSKEREGGSLVVLLKTPGGVRHRFRVHIRKIADGYMLTNKLILTLNDLDYALM